VKNISHYKESNVCNGNVPWMLKVVHGTINAIMEPMERRKYLNIIKCTCFFSFK